ncbi:hypothetical protein DM02DRAFT_613992 [Periconia macrospinosa]|uniref:PH domain-containing protein n=1 Tax=Periconia macrospinosa TaxID=97972 RepID=A0A2V1DRP1_9PLEO|nr:hypothetical protein DM02DRAFT_613992 [Periconia macrospinosa]
MAAEPAPSEPPGPPKFSRYRSVRRQVHAHAHAQAEQPPLPVIAPTIISSPSASQASPIPNATPQAASSSPSPAMPPLPLVEQSPAPAQAPMARSMSRYHRRPTTSHAPTAKLPPLRSATVQVPPLPATTTNPSTAPRYRALSSPQAPPSNHAPPRMPNTSHAKADPTTSNSRPRTARDEAKQLMQDEAERHRRIREKQEIERQERLRVEQADRERQEQQRREEEQLRQQEEARIRVEREAREAAVAQRQQEERDRGKRLQKAESAKRIAERNEAERRAQALSPPDSPQRTGRGFGIFNRKKDESPGSPGNGLPDVSMNTNYPQISHEDRDMDNIKAGGGGAVLGIDAPISAVNAGDRRVTIICNKKKFLLPVTPDTTAQDLLKSAALCMTEAINPRTDIFIENFQKVGVQRPVRLYEHVRDIMNSWDNDLQNDLEIVNAAYHGHDRSHLVSNEVPDKKPEGITCYLHHSSRPGKWNKRFITLRPDGQLGMMKNETAKDLENICHLSDFDIYTPTKRKQSKIKPPKKHCYAVKSQQKSNIFSDESRYVHFFSTNDSATATRFLDAVQAWRSWHLKHVMGEGHKKPKAAEVKPSNGIVANAKALSALEQNGTSSHNRNTSVGSFYQLGSFQPLFDMDQFGKDMGAVTNSAPDVGLQRADTKAMHARKMSVRSKKPPPAAFERSGALINDVPSLPMEPSKSLTESSSRPAGETFASTGLLGRTYTHRQKAMQEREQKASGPFTEGPSLVGNIDAMAAAAASNESGVKRRASVHSTTHRRTSSDIQRSVSTRAKPRPLVDLTPQYREPPQHRNKGKGFDPGANSGPLVESATSVEEAIKVPSSTDWRGGRPGTARVHGTYGTGGHERTRSMKGRGEGLAAYTVNNHNGAPDDDRNAFTGGLLARAGFSQGHQPVGRGVMDGSKAKGPMLDMSEGSQFASGSLLADVQRRQGTGGPVVDRDRD